MSATVATIVARKLAETDAQVQAYREHIGPCAHRRAGALDDPC